MCERIAMAKHLYVIGNGFDLHHKISCGFKDYAEWLKKNHSDLYYEIENRYEIQDEELWSNFEHLLGELDVRANAEQIASDRHPSYQQLANSTDKEYDDWVEWYRLSSDEARDEFEDLFENVRDTFRDWVEQLENPDVSCKIPMDTNDSMFLTFNYTDTLETLYCVPEKRILYIHGKADRGDRLILGHGLTEGDIRDRNAIQVPPEYDTPEKMEEFFKSQGDLVQDETFDEVCKQLAGMQKPVGELLRKLLLWLAPMKDIEHIHIYGLSFSDIDMPYIEEIASQVDLTTVQWEATYFKPTDREKYQESLCALGVPEKNITMTTLKKIRMYGCCKLLF